MADSTRSKTNIIRIEDAIARLTSNQFSLTATQNSMSLKLDELLQKMATLETQPHSPSHSTSPPQPSPTLHGPRLKLEIPRFYGSDPLGWIFKITQFFEYHATPESEHLTLASFSMEGQALPWFQWMASNDQLTSWAIFLNALQSRFAPSHYDDPTDALFKLTQ